MSSFSVLWLFFPQNSVFCFLTCSAFPEWSYLLLWFQIHQPRDHFPWTRALATEIFQNSLFPNFWMFSVRSVCPVERPTWQETDVFRQQPVRTLPRATWVNLEMNPPAWLQVQELQPLQPKTLAAACEGPWARGPRSSDPEIMTRHKSVALGHCVVGLFLTQQWIAVQLIVHIPRLKLSVYRT